MTPRPKSDHGTKMHSVLKIHLHSHPYRQYSLQVKKLPAEGQAESDPINMLTVAGIRSTSFNSIMVNE